MEIFTSHSELVVDAVISWCADVKQMSSGANGYTDEVLFTHLTFLGFLKSGDIKSVRVELESLMPQVVAAIRTANWPKRVVVDAHGGGVEIWRAEAV